MANALAEAWTAVIMGEAAAIYAYSIGGPRVAPAQRGAAEAAYDRHEDARDAALLALSAMGTDPAALPNFFELPNEVATPAQASALLATVESRLAVVYADLIEQLPLDQRQSGLDGVLDATAQALVWGAAPGPWGAAEPEQPEP